MDRTLAKISASNSFASQFTIKFSWFLLLKVSFWDSTALSSCSMVMLTNFQLKSLYRSAPKVPPLRILWIYSSRNQKTYLQVTKRTFSHAVSSLLNNLVKSSRHVEFEYHCLLWKAWVQVCQWRHATWRTSGEVQWICWENVWRLCFVLFVNYD